MSLNKPILKLRDWIDIDNLEMEVLAINKNAIELLKQNLEKINWYNLSFNKNEIHKSIKFNKRIRT